ncbi:MAG TPA: hypothetical protein VEH48_01660 [Candidatus Nitrosopolaris sp.]|nr:hypothetical protein [Candidatus Nitrosopolaris sp.]
MSERKSREARSDVRALAATDIGRLGIGLDSAETLDPIKRKRMEYALLIGPISRGLAEYLDTYQFDKPRSHISGASLLNLVGSTVAQKIVEQLQRDPSFPITSKLAYLRANDFEKPLSNNIYPLGMTIITAADSSANALYDSAAANALTAQAAGASEGRTRAEFIDIVKRSTRLPLARTFAALAWQQGLDEAIYRQALQQISSAGELESLLEYDPEKAEVRPTKPIENWPDFLNHSSKGGSATIGDIKPADERIGCPVSFSPRLVVRYYEHMVDLMEYHQSWPEVLDSSLPRIDIF